MFEPLKIIQIYKRELEAGAWIGAMVQEHINKIKENKRNAFVRVIW